MFEAVENPYLVAGDGSFRVKKAETKPPKGAPDEAECERRLGELVVELDDLQRKLYAQDRLALLLVFQAMDGAGKDSTIRAVMRGINPSGCQVYSFKQPSAEELDHEFLWRTARCLPERGRIGIFNRSYYEEALVVRVHPEYLAAQRIPGKLDSKGFWRDRYESIRDHERHLARNGTVVVKFWLNVSKGEQKRRFLSRIDEPHKNWKFSAADVKEREFWKDYMEAYEDAINATSRPWAPWYAIPADDKPFMRYTVAQTIVDTLKSLDLKYPKVSEATKAKFAGMRAALEGNSNSGNSGT